MDLNEIRDVLNDNRHLNSRWIIFTKPPEHEEIYFQSAAGDQSHALTVDEAEKAAQTYLARPLN